MKHTLIISETGLEKQREKKSCTGIEKTTEASLNAKRKSLQWNIFRMSICLISILIASASLKSEIQDHNKFYCCSQNLLKKQNFFSFETQIIFFSRQRLCGQKLYWHTLRTNKQTVYHHTAVYPRVLTAGLHILQPVVVPSGVTSQATFQSNAL